MLSACPQFAPCIRDSSLFPPPSRPQVIFPFLGVRPVRCYDPDIPLPYTAYDVYAIPKDKTAREGIVIWIALYRLSIENDILHFLDRDSSLVDSVHGVPCPLYPPLLA